MDATTMKALWADFKFTFNDNGWFQTTVQQRVLTSIERTLNHEKNPHKRCQALLKTLYRAQHHQVADADRIHQLIGEVLTTWLLQEKPDRTHVQAVIRDLVGYGFKSGKHADPKLVQLFKDLSHIGAQMAYYRIDEAYQLPSHHPDAGKDRLKQRQQQLQQFVAFLKDYAETNAVPFATQQEGINFYHDLESTFKAIDQSGNHEPLDQLPANSLFQSFFSSTTYDEQGFVRYREFIQDWLASKVKKDPADEVILLHLLRQGIEQIPKERESAGFRKGYKLFSSHAEQWIAFLTQIHQQYGLPDTLKLQALQEDIMLGQARLLDSPPNLVRIGELLEELASVLHRPDISRERLEPFSHQLLELGLEKCVFLKGKKLNKFDLFAILSTVTSYHRISWNGNAYRHKRFGIEFLLLFVEHYRQEQIGAFIQHKDFSSLWGFCNSISFTVFSEENAQLLNGLREALKQTLIDWLGSFTSLDDYVNYLETAKASQTSLLDTGYYSNYADFYRKSNAATDAPPLRALFSLNHQQLAVLLKTRADYQKLLKALVVDVLTYEEQHSHIKNSDFVTDQINVLMQINRDTTLSVLYELKANYEIPLTKTWSKIETRVLAPDRARNSPLLAALINVTRTAKQENALLVKVSQALNDETLCRDLVAMSSSPNPSITAALTQASIQLLQVFYQSLNTTRSDANSVEKQLVAHTLILFMTAQKPSAEDFKAMIHTLYALKQKYLWSDTSTDYQFIVDILLLRAQFLRTAEEFKAYLELLTKVQAQYQLSSNSVEHELQSLVEGALSALEQPNIQISANVKTITQFKPKSLFSHFGLTQYVTLFESLSALRQTYAFSLDKADRSLLKQLLAEGLSCIKPSPTWNSHYYFPIALRFCAACQDDRALLHSAFNILEKSLDRASHLLGNLKRTPLEQQFIHYVIQRDTARVFEVFKEPQDGAKSWDNVICRIYKTLKSQGLTELMRSDFLMAYFDQCVTLSDYQAFARFVIYRMPYADKAAPDLFKQLAATLSFHDYRTLLQRLVNDGHTLKALDKLADFLFTTLEIIASKVTTPTERTDLLDLIKELKEKIIFSAPDKQREFNELLHQIAMHQWQKNLLAMERMGKALETLEVTDDIRGAMERFEGYRDEASEKEDDRKKPEEHNDKEIYLQFTERLAKYQVNLDKAKVDYDQRVQPIKNNQLLDSIVDAKVLGQLVTESEEARNKVDQIFKEITDQRKTLLQDLKEKLVIVENSITVRYIAASEKFNQFLTTQSLRQTTESESRATLETRRKDTANLIATIQHRDPTKSTEITQQIEQVFSALDNALQQKAVVLGGQQNNIAHLIAEFKLLQAEPNVAFKLLSNKLDELNRALTSAEDGLQNVLPELKTAEETLSQAQAFANTVQQQEAKQQQDFEVLQKAVEKLLLDMDAKLQPQATRLSDYQQQRAKFEFAALKGLDDSSRTNFIASEQRLVTVFTALEGPMVDFSKQYQAQQQTLQTARQTLSATLADPKLSLLERETVVKQFEFEMHQLDRLVKGVLPQLAEMEKSFEAAQVELAMQQSRMLTAFDQQMDKRVKQVEVLRADIAKHADEVAKLRANVKDDGENDAWFLQAIAFYRDTLPMEWVSEEEDITKVLSDLPLRQAALQHLLANTDEARVEQEKSALLQFNAMQRFSNILLPRLQAYRGRIENMFANNRMALALAEAVLTVFDHSVLAALPFVSFLKAFRQDQQALVRYQQSLLAFETPCETLMALQQPLSVETALSLIAIQKQLQHHLMQLQTQTSNPFFADLAKAWMEDDVEEAKSASLDAATKVLKSEHAHVNHWLLSEADVLATSANALIARLSQLQTQSAHYDEAGDTLLKGLEEQARLNELSAAIETKCTAKAKTEQSLETLQTELNTLVITQQRFVDDIAREHYQICVNRYHAKADSGVSPLALLLNDKELTAEQKQQLFNVLVQRYPACVNQRDEQQQTPLHLATLQGDMAFIEALLKVGAHVDLKNAEGKTSLELALLAQQTAIIRVLKRSGAKSDGRVATAVLQQCIAKNDVVYAEFLLKRKNGLKVAIHQSDAEGNTALHQAVQQKHLALISLLLAHGAKPESKNAQGKMALDQERKNTLLHVAAKVGDVTLFHQLVHLGADIKSRDAKNHTLLLTVYVGLASAKDPGQRAQFKQLFNQVAARVKFDPEDRLDDGDTLLHLAAKLGDVDTIERFAISTGLLMDTRHTDSQNAFQETPLHLAVKGGHSEAVRVLLQKGANLNRQNKAGETALSLAAHQGQINLVKWLFLNGARLDIRNLEGQTAFNTPQGRIVFRQLVPSTTKLNLADKERLVKQGGGDALLHLAVEEGDTKWLQWLIENQRLDLNVKDGEGYTLLGLLSQPQFFTALRQDCDPKDAEYLLGIRSPGKDLAVESLATLSKRQVYLKYFIEKGARFWEAQDKAGNHLLHLLVARGFDDKLVKDLVNRLIFFRRNAVLNALNSEGETLLHLALKQGSVELIASLVEKGARLDITNRDGEKPFDTKAGMAMYLTLKGEVIDDQSLPWLTRLRKWMEGRDYSGLVNQIEANQQAAKEKLSSALNNEQPSFFDQVVQEDEETLLQDSHLETNPFALQEKSRPETSIADVEDKPSWFDEVDQEVKETSSFEQPGTNVPLSPQCLKAVQRASTPASTHSSSHASSVPIYPAVFKTQTMSTRRLKTSAVKRVQFRQGDDFDCALQHGQYETARKLLKGHQGYQSNVSFQALPRAIKRYLLLDSKTLPKETALAHAKKSLRLEETYVEKHDALYDAVVDGDSTFVAEWFNAHEERVKAIEKRVKRGDKGASVALALCNSQLFEVVSLQRGGMTLFELLVEREKMRQLYASGWSEDEAFEQAWKRHEDGNILRILMAYVPTSALSLTVAEGLALYDLVDTSLLKPAPLKVTSLDDNVMDVDHDAFGASALTEITLPIGREEAPISASKPLPGWLRDAQKLLTEITGFISETLIDAKEKAVEAQQQAAKQMIEIVVAPKDLIDVYHRYQPAALAPPFTTEGYDLSVMALEKPPVREVLDKAKHPLPMLIRHQNHLYFYGLTPGGMTLLEPLNYDQHSVLHDSILPEQGYDIVVMPKPIMVAGMEDAQPSDAFDEQELEANEFRLRWDEAHSAICYRVKDIQGRERSGFISTKEREELWIYLGGNSRESRYFACLDALYAAAKNPQKAAELLKPYFPQLLHITHKRKHTSVIKPLSKAQISAELYEAIGNIKGHIHGMLPADQRQNQGQILAEKMNAWINDEMGKNFKGADIVDVRDHQGNTLLHLAVRDHLDVLVEWLLPSSLTQDVKHWVEKTFADLKGKLLTVGASEAGGALGNVAAAAVGTIVAGAALPVLGPLSIAAGVLAGKLTSMFAEGASGLAAEKIYDAAKAQILLSLEQRIDVHHQNHEGDTVLHIAARTIIENNLWIVSALLAKAQPEEINMLNQAGDSALHLAVKHRNAHIVALLLLAGANLNLPNAEGKTPLHLAAIQGDEPLFQMLIESGANIYAQTKLGQTAEQLLTKKISLLDEQRRKVATHPEELAQLADATSRYERMLNLLHNNQSLLQRAQQLNHENDAKQVEQQKTTWWDNAEKTTRQRSEKPVETDAQGNTLLHVLVQNKANYDLVEDLLLHHHINDLNQPNQDGNTPLHLAVSHPGNSGTNAKMIQLLLAHGANPYVTNQDGKTPIKLVPDPRYQYKIDALFHPSHAQKKDNAETEFFSKTRATSAQKPLNLSNNNAKNHNPFS